MPYNNTISLIFIPAFLPLATSISHTILSHPYPLHLFLPIKELISLTASDSSSPKSAPSSQKYSKSPTPN